MKYRFCTKVVNVPCTIGKGAISSVIDPNTHIDDTHFTHKQYVQTDLHLERIGNQKTHTTKKKVTFLIIIDEQNTKYVHKA